MGDYANFVPEFRSVVLQQKDRQLIIEKSLYVKLFAFRKSLTKTPSFRLTPLCEVVIEPSPVQNILAPLAFCQGFQCSLATRFRADREITPNPVLLGENEKSRADSISF
jgi:hypothetical protein